MTQDLNFLEFLQGYRRGSLLDRADRDLNELMDAIAETGRGGTLTLTLTVKVNKAGQIEIAPDVKTKSPRPDLGVGIYFVSDTGRLTRRDPNQMDIEDEIARRKAMDQ